MPLSRFNWRLRLLLLAAGATFALAGAAHNATTRAHVSALSLEEFDEQLQECPLIRELNEHRFGATAAPSTPTAKLFALLFPGSPAVNALLATLYISGPPNLLLALCPPDIDPASLSVMVAFAVGGLLGDTLFHLLPEIFLGEAPEDRVRLVLVEPNRNLLLGVAILVGFVTFVAMDKGLRIATGGAAGHDHGHAHGAGGSSHAHADDGTGGDRRTGQSSAVELVTANCKTGSSSGAGARNRKNENGSAKAGSDLRGDHSTQEILAEKDETLAAKEANASVKLGGYLNLIADFTHNITDGLAMSASFYASPTIGATTTVAIFFHEIPHEVGDFALLVQSGFSKRAAMGAQFVTAIGALLGTLIGIAVQELGGGSRHPGGPTAEGGGGGALLGEGMTAGLFGTSLAWGDLLLPFTAGTFLYVGTVAVIPELLEVSGAAGSKGAEIRKTLVQFAAIALGAGIMLYISWHE